MAFHTDKSFEDVLKFLPAEFREPNLEDVHVFREQVEEVLVQLTRQPEAEADKLFEFWTEVKEKRSKKGGRPADTALDTAVMALANVYGDRTDDVIDNLPYAASSLFVQFLAACLAPVSISEDQTEALGKRWKELRKVMRGEYD